MGKTTAAGYGSKGAAKAAPTLDLKALKTGDYFKDANGVVYRIGVRPRLWGGGGYPLYRVKGSPSSDQMVTGSFRPGSDRVKSRPQPWQMVDPKTTKTIRAEIKERERVAKAKATIEAAMKKQKAAEAKKVKEAKAKEQKVKEARARVQKVMDLIAEIQGG